MSILKIENDTFYQDSQGDVIDDRNETYYQRDRTSMVIKSNKILLAHLIKEVDIIKDRQGIDPVEVLLSLILEEEILSVTKEIL